MIICAGESLIDFVPETPDGSRYRPVPGGSPMNCAVTAARLGGRAAFAGAISKDFFGDRILSHLQSNGVDLSLVQRVENPTTLAFVNTTDGENARYAFYTNGSADRALTPDQLPTQLPAAAILQIGSISLIGTPAGDTLVEFATKAADEHIVAVDPNIRANLVDDEVRYRKRLSDAAGAAAIFKTSEEDLAWLFPGRSEEDSVEELFRRGTELVLITRGAGGSCARTATATVDVPAHPVAVADTIGAGDAFMGATLTWLEAHAILRRDQLRELSTAQLELLVAFASQVSAVTCTRVGADPPWRSELEPPQRP
jgi:fructokinase